LGPETRSENGGQRYCFNSSVGILSVGTDGGGSHVGSQFTSFNSSVGILSVGTSNMQSDSIGTFPGFNSSVGILSVGTYNHTSYPSVGRCFNSSVGILSVGTRRWLRRRRRFLGFQFLSRNSVRWDRTSLYSALSIIPVSIPQSEFCPLGPAYPSPQRPTRLASFNSSVGILSVGT